LFRFGYDETLSCDVHDANDYQDTSTNPAVRRAFADRVAPVEGEVKERLVGVESDSSESEDEGIPEAEGKTGDGWESMEED
jgi:periodic tryptophan protein 1